MWCCDWLVDRLTIGLVGCVLAAAASGQRSAAIDGVALHDARLWLDPSRALEVEALDDDGARQAWRLTFPPYGMPQPGDHVLGGEDELGLVVGTTAGLQPAIGGSLHVDRFDPERVAGSVTFTFGGENRTLAFDGAPWLRPLQRAQVTSIPLEEPWPADRPDRDDLVFAAMGNTGTGLSGARWVADSLAWMAPTGPLDFTLLLGNVLEWPGVESFDDPRFGRDFEDLFDPERLAVPFHVVPGEREHLGSLDPLFQHGVFNTRWSMPDWVYWFDVQSHGVTFRFVGIDTEAAGGDIGNPVNRAAHRKLSSALHDSHAQWKIVFGATPLYSGGEPATTPAAKALQREIGSWLPEFGADLYFAGAPAATEVIDPGNGVLYVNAGGGGGPEAAAAVRWGPATRFATTGGGFVWCRYDGKALEITIRDADGRPVWLQRLTK